MPASVIAIDGPAASGKSSVGLQMARRLGYRFVDTGSMYRALAWQALRKGVPFDDESALALLAQSTPLDVLPSSPDGEGAVLVEGADVTPFLHDPDVDAKVSLVARVPAVRKILVEAQRRLAEQGGMVMVGRDIGDVVLPDADVKIYLDASVDERASRRYRDMEHQHDITYEDVLNDMLSRDELDRTRPVSPLRPAHGAIYVSTDRMTLDQVVEYLLALTNG